MFFCCSFYPAASQHPAFLFMSTGFARFLLLVPRTPLCQELLGLQHFRGRCSREGSTPSRTGQVLDFMQLKQQVVFLIQVFQLLTVIYPNP